MPFKKQLFASNGKYVIISKEPSLIYKNIYMGNKVYIDGNALFMCTKVKIYLGNNIMFGPKVSIITGGHRMDITGKYMLDIKGKRAGDDRDII
jgi:acetyltransferase-like isoleucine patch superfamily enzyme